jgi:hypothetical protein
MNWQPIHTAPKNAEPILLSDGSGVSVGCWSGRWVAVANDRPAWEHDGEGFVSLDLDPTHWMPLPDPAR